MKKVWMLAVVAGLLSFTACKKTAEGVAEDAGNAVEATTDAASAAGDAVVDGAEGAANAAGDAANTVKDGVAGLLGLDVPSFENADLQQWANDLKDAGAAALEAASKGDTAKLQEAQTKFVSLKESLMTYKDSPEFAKAEQFYKDIQAKVSGDSSEETAE